MKKLLIVISICIALCLCAIPTSARDVEQGGTITVGEEHLNIQCLEGSVDKSIGWWAPGLQSGFPDEIINLSLGLFFTIKNWGVVSSKFY